MNASSGPARTNEAAARAARAARLPPCVLAAALALAACAAWATPGWSQVVSASTYPFTFGSGATLEDMSSGTTELVGPNQDSGVSGLTPIGFDFWFVGTRQSQFSVNSNGLMRLGPFVVGSASTNNLASASQAPQIAPYWDDSRTGSNGKVHYKVVGAAPNRTLVVEWLNMQVPRGASGAAGTATWQCRLYESTGIIEFVFGPGMNTNTAQGGASIGFGSSASQFASVTSSVPSVAYGVADNANTDPIASGTWYEFVPPVPAAPSDLNFSQVGAISLQLDWSDNASDEVGYLIERSLDGVSWTIVEQTAAEATSSLQAGLMPSTTYHWRVRAVSEGALSAGVTGSQTTGAAGLVATAGSGNWSSTVPDAPWPGGVVPGASDDVVISDGHTVVVDSDASCYSLTVGGGTSGVLEFEDAAARTLTAGGDVTVSAGAELRTATTGTQTGHTLSVGGDLVNDGVLELSTNGGQAGAGLVFTGALDASFTGAGSVTDLLSLTVSKGSDFGSVLTLAPSTLSVRGQADPAGPFVTLSSGTLRIGGTFTMSDSLFSSNSWSIGSNDGLWLDNPNFTVMGRSGSASVAGLLRVSAGTLNVGLAANQNLTLSNGGTLVIEGGAVNVAGRCAVSSTVNRVDFTQTGGVLTVATVGNTSTGFASFDLGNFALTSSTMSGGAIVLRNRSSAASGPRDYRNNAEQGAMTGGTLQFADASSPDSLVFSIAGRAPGLSFSGTTVGHTAQLIAPTRAYGLTAIGAGDTLRLNGNLFSQAEGDLLNDGVLIATGATSELRFAGEAAPQTYSGSGTIRAPLTALSLDNPAGLVLDSAIATNVVTARANLIRGTLVNSQKLTVGADSVKTIVQIGGSGLDASGGAFDTTPAFSIGSGTLSLWYFDQSVPRTTSFEIPPGRSVDSLVIASAPGVDLAGGTLIATKGLSLVSGTLRTSSANLLQLTNAVTPPAGSAASFVDGPLAVEVNTGGSVSKAFAIGRDGMFRPMILKSVSTGGVSRVFTGEVVAGATGGSPVAPLQSLASARYWRIGNSANLNAAARVNLAFGPDDNVGTLADLRVAQANTVPGAYASLGGTATGTQASGTVESTTNLTAGRDYFAIGSVGVLASTWDGGAGTQNWGDAANWSPDGVPGASTNVSLALGSPTTIAVNGAFALNNLILGANTTLNLAGGSLAVGGTYSQSGSTVNAGGGALSVTGTTTLNGGTLNVGSGTFAGTGNVTVSGAAVTVASGGTLLANATFALSSGSIALGSGTLEVKGAFTRTGGTFNAQTGTTLFSGTTTQTITGGVTHYNLVLRNGGAGQPKRFTAEAGYNVANHFTVESPAQISLTANNETFFPVYGDFRFSGVGGGTGIGNFKVLLRGIGHFITDQSGATSSPAAATATREATFSLSEPPTTVVNFLTDPATAQYVGERPGGKPQMVLENTYARKQAEVDQLLASADPGVRLVVNLDDMTIVRDPEGFAPLASTYAAMGNVSEFPMPVYVEPGASYSLGGNASIASSRLLSVSGRLDCGTWTIGGAGGVSVTSQGVLGTATASPSGLGGTIVTAGTDTYTDGAAIEYNAAGNQTISAANHPAAAKIHLAGSGTKTLAGNLTLTGSSDFLLSDGVLLVPSGTTFADGGYRLSIVTSGFGNVVVEGGFVSSGAGAISYESGAFDSNVRAADGTAFGDLLINFNTSTLPLDLNANGTANISFRNVTFGGSAGSGQAGGTLHLNESGTTNVTVTGDVTLAPEVATNTGGGFGGTAATTGRVTVLGDLVSSSQSATQPLFDATGTNRLVLAGAGPQLLQLGADATVMSGTTLEVQNPAGLTLGDNGTICSIGPGGTFDIGATNVTTQSSTLDLSQGGTLLRTTGRVVGRLKKSVSTGPANVSFELGSPTEDLPVQLAFGNVGTAGAVTAASVAGDHPAAVAAGLDVSKSLNRHFALENDGVVFDAASATFGYAAAELDAAANPDSLLLRKGDAGVWTTLAGWTLGGSSLQVPGLTSFSDFALGEQGYVTITASATPGGTVSPAGVTTIPYDGGAAFSITPNLGYGIVDVLVDVVSVGPITDTTFTNVTADRTIHAVFELTSSLIGAGPAPSPISTAFPCITIPVTIERTDSLPIRAFSVGVTLSGNLALCAGPASIVEGTFLSGAGETFFQVVDLGGGAYQVDGAVLGTDCGAAGLTGDLFTLQLASAAPFDTGNVWIGSLKLRDCVNTPLPTIAGDSLDIAIDNTPPSVTLLVPNGAEAWGAGSPQTITWTATDAAGVDSVELAWSPDGGQTWPFTIASGLANSGSYAWTVPDTSLTTVRVRVTAFDAGANTASDASDADFTIRPYEIVSSAGPNGTISPLGLVTAVWGDTVQFTVTPDPGYRVLDVLVDGVSVGAPTSYDFPGVAADHTIEASFALDQFTITATAGANGSITPSGAVVVDYGNDQSFTITPDPGHHVLDVLVDAVSVGAVGAYTFTNVTADHTIDAQFEVNPPVAAITTLAAAQVKTGNPAGSTTGIVLTWSDAPAATTVEVYRAPFGDYPEYDDGAGAAPAVPAYPPPAPWVLTAVTASGQTDATGVRDFYYFVAFATDTFGTVSPPSNMTGGTLNYHLGDFSDGVTVGVGDNQVNTADLSLLGAHYGISGGAVAGFAYLDVGPTTDFSVNGRPTTDNLVNFEDLVMLALNYTLVSAPQAGSGPAVAGVSGGLLVDSPARVAAGETVLARLTLPGPSAVQALSVALTWDPAVVEPVASASEESFDDQGGIVLSDRPGTIDAALLGVRGAGIAGPFGTVTFRAIADGDPKIRVEHVEARSAANEPLDLVVRDEPQAAPGIPAITSLAPVMPNPFRGSATIEFGLARGGQVELAVYGIDGRRVRTLVSGARAPGMFRLQWDGRDQAGGAVRPGVFYLKLATPDGAFTRRIVNVR